MAGNGVCGKCGAVLPSDAPEGLCSVCVLEAGLDFPTRHDITLRVEEGRSVGQPGAETPLNPAKPLAVLGEYELLAEIARGGQGVVYRARQRSLNRLVALKMIALGSWATEAHLKRFKTEAEAAANLDHPQIVPIYEIGQATGQHYFTMKLIEGVSLKQVVADGPLEPHRAATIMATVGRAIHYAHQRGILHRDIKPGNILLDARQQPHVTDFGLAKLVENESTVTNTMDVLGTPSYMSPEQASGQAKLVSTATDVYGLGAVLYELLTGHPPFAGGTTMETIRLVLEKEPERPSLKNSNVDRDLATICVKCLEKEPNARYGSAEALAEDLERWLRKEPIVARPSTVLERAGKWARRKPVVASLGAATVLLLLTVAIGSPIAVFRINRERQQLRLHLYVADVNNAHQAVRANNLQRALELLQKRILKPGQEDLRGFEWRHLWQSCQGEEIDTFGSPAQTPTCAVFSPRGNLFVTAGDKTVSVFDVASKQRTTLSGFDDKIDLRALAFSPDGLLLAAKGGTNVIIWETTNWQVQKRLEGVPNWNLNNAVVFSPDGRTLATRIQGGVGVWDTQSWERIPAKPLLDRLGSFGTVLAYSTDGKIFAASDGNSVHLFDPQSWSCIGSITNTVAQADRILSLAFSTNLVAAGYRFGDVTLMEIGTWRQIAMTNAHRSCTTAVAFSKDGQTLATAGSDALIHLWEIAVPPLDALGAAAEQPPIALKKTRTFKGHLDRIDALAFSPDGQRLATASADGTARFWDVTSKHEEKNLKGAGFPLWFSPDGRRLITANSALVSNFLDVSDWDLPTGRESRIHIPLGTNIWFCRAVSADGQTLALGMMASGAVDLWSLQSGRRLATFKASEHTVFSLAFAPSNGVLASAGMHEQTVRVWNPAAMREVIALPGAMSPLAFSPDGKVLVTGSTNEGIKMWDWATQKTLAALEGHPDPLSLAFSSKGNLFAAGWGKTVEVWNTKSLQSLAVLRGHKSKINYILFSPDSKTLVSVTYDNEVTLWNLRTSQELFTVDGLAGYTRAPLFSPDGNMLALAANEAQPELDTMKLWRAPPLEEIDARRGIKSGRNAGIKRTGEK